MKKNFMSLTFAVLTILFGTSIVISSCSSKQSGVDEQGNPIPTTRDSLEIALANQDSLLVLMNDISEGMMQIKSLENILSNTNINGESASRKEQIKHDMQAIEMALADRRMRLEELEKKLNASYGTNSTLKKSIATLKEQITVQESTISGLRDDLAKANIKIEELNNSVDSLHNDLTAVTVEKEKVQERNQELINDMNAVYYAIGTSKELKEAGLLKPGGFLRSAKINPAEFNASTFNKADKRTLTTLPLHSKKAKVMTSQPKNSYNLVESDGQMTLVIIDSELFWNQSPYLVVKID